MHRPRGGSVVTGSEELSVKGFVAGLDDEIEIGGLVNDIG